MNTKNLMVAALFAAMSIGSAFAQIENMQGKPVPAFKMTDTKGKVHTDKTLRGKVVLVDFWATWCGPCKAASPTMQALHTKYAKSGLVVIGANAFERGNSKAAAQKYAAEHKYTYNFTIDNTPLASAWGVQGIPAFVIIDRKGKVAKVEVGYDPGATPAQFEATIKKLLAAK